MGGSGAIFHIFGEATASTEPGQRSFHDPTPGDDLKADCRVGPFDCFYFHMRQNFLTGLFENGTLVSAIGKEFLQKRKPAEQGSKDQNAAIPVLETGRMDHGVKQQPYRVDKDVALLSLDFLARVIA